NREQHPPGDTADRRRCRAHRALTPRSVWPPTTSTTSRSRKELHGALAPPTAISGYHGGRLSVECADCLSLSRHPPFWWSSRRRKRMNQSRNQLAIRPKRLADILRPKTCLTSRAEEISTPGRGLVRLAKEATAGRG